MLDKKDIKKILDKAPKAPGIYKMKDKEGRVLYIGKAKDIKKRLNQYFQKSAKHPIKTHKLLEKVDKIDFTTVDSELEAMILETNLIKQFQPKYNILMKDDKNYVYIKITKEDFPRIQIVRKIEKDNAKYIGPKTASNKVKETFKFLKKIFPFRHCGLDIEFIKEKSPPEKNEVKVTRKVIKYPCLDYYIKRCAAPCIGCCSPEEYQKIINNVENFLKGKADEILTDLNDQMQNFAQNKEFEKAVKIRDKITKIKETLEKQKVSDPKQTDKDIINYLISHERAYFNLFQIRDGKLIGQENFILSAKDVEEHSQENEVLEAFLNQYYKIATDVPKEILIPHETENKKQIEQMFDKKVKILVPQKGTKNKLLEMSLKNARIFADRNKPSWQTESKITEKAVKELKNLLKLSSVPKRIECYDISHLSGTTTVGSMIVFIKGVPDKSMYRKFKIKTIKNKPDDYKSMEEVLKRRFQKISLDFLHKDYVFKKSRKKDKSFIEKNNDVKLEKTKKDFFILEKGKNPIGFIALDHLSNKVSELTNLWVEKKERGKKLGYKLIKGAIQKAKTKRVYIICKEELKEYYLLTGFEEIKKVPEELVKHCKKCERKFKNIAILVYDKNKHKEDKSFSQIPDLVIIDGGKGQLSTALKVLKEMKLKIPVISLAKKLDEIFLPNQKKSIILEKNNEALKLLQRARDEAHRFAISYNKQLRSKKFQ